jgi:pimeloyl-ACP methyl ester carboxylesterase
MEHAGGVSHPGVRRPLLNALLFFPEQKLLATPLTTYEEVTVETEDGERLHAWWIPAERPVGHVLFCHGNGGNIGDRVLHAALLHRAGLDVLLFDYRGYGRSTGRASEEGTYRDARAARTALLGRREVNAGSVLYVGESLGGAVATALAHEAPPAGVVLVSTFTSVRDMARRHYPFVPAAAVPDAYPSLRLVRDLRAPLLVLHGDRDDLVPLMSGEELYEAAPEPKTMHVLAGVGHNDLVSRAGDEWAAAIAEFAGKVCGGG